jgi:ribosome recycling factor
MTPEEILSQTEEMMKNATRAYQHECSKIRTGRANTAILDGIDVDCYGSKSPIMHVANVSVPEPRLIIIQPYDRSLIKAIESALFKSDIGLTPSNDGAVIRLVIPNLTEERRKELVKVIRKISEEAKVSVRNHRHHAVDQIKKGEKDGLIPQDVAKKTTTQIQDLTDRYNHKVDEIFKEKEQEILTV